MNQTYMDIKITRTLLDKNVSELTDIEREAVERYKERVSKRSVRLFEANDIIKKDCPILCSGYDSQFIPSYGWIEPITDFCYQLEALNIQYVKYGIKVTSSQNKEKFGTYRCYYDITDVPCGVLKYPIKICDMIVDRLDKINYGVKYIEDECPKVTIEWEEITKEEFENGVFENSFKNRDRRLVWNDDTFDIFTHDRKWVNYLGEEKHETIFQIRYKDKDSEYVTVDFQNENVFSESDGKYYMAYELHHGPKTHIEYTKHRFLRRIGSIFWNMRMFFEFHNRLPSVNSVMRRDFETKVEKLYSECEKECQKRCEVCGYQIGKDTSPECVTHGWISYVCEDCAMASGGEYTKDGQTWEEGNRK